MMTYIISFILCSGLLLLAYHAFLSKENLYRFNRFYLLFSLVFAIAVPFITIKAPALKIPYFNSEPVQATVLPAADKSIKQTVYQPITDDVGLQQTAINQTPTPVTQPITKPSGITVMTAAKQPVVQHINYLPFLPLALYGAISLLMLIRFVRNSFKIRSRVVENTIVKYDNEGTQLVLINEDVTPHSFLNYIFINRDDYNSGAIEPEIICHEQTHVKQLHSVDIIMIELLQIVCWFNPFIPFYRRAIQLNHEFLADEAVIKNYDNTPAYQYLLLAKASQASSLNLTSQFNYRATKKRLIMMTKRTSATIALYKKLAVLPFLAVAIFLFCQKSTAEIVKAVKPAVTVVVKADTSKITISKELEEADAERTVRQWPIPAGGRTKHAIKDAPPAVINAYKAILTKYDIQLWEGYGKGKLSDITSTDTAQLHKLFSQMSAKQQDSQYVRFEKPFKPLPKNKVTTAQLQLWQDAKTYGVWIDEKRIKNATLANYKPDDFDHMFFSNLTPMAIKNDGFKYQVSLMTKAYYADYHKKEMAGRGDKLIRIRAKKKQLIIHNNDLTNKSSFKFPPPIIHYEGSSASYIKVVGEVRYPGNYALPKGNELAQELIKKAGGVTPQGSIENIQVFRAGKRVKIDFVSADSKDVLLSGDSVVVPPRPASGKLNKMQQLKKNNALTIPSIINEEPMFVTNKSSFKFPPPIVYPDIQGAKQDAPQSVMDEYTAILSKYPSENGHPVAPPGHSFFSDADLKRLESLYKQMSKIQQLQQTVVFYPPFRILPKSYPTEKLFTDWKARKYGIWIDDKRVTYAELANYKASDFDRYHVIPFKASIEINGGIAGQVNLMTKAYYAAYFKYALTDTMWRLGIVKRRANSLSVKSNIGKRLPV